MFLPHLLTHQRAEPQHPELLWILSASWTIRALLIELMIAILHAASPALPLLSRLLSPQQRRARRVCEINLWAELIRR